MVSVPDAVKLSPTSSLPERMTGTAERDGNEAALIKRLHSMVGLIFLI